MIWKLVLNVYTAHVNREVSIGHRFVQIRVDSAAGKRIRIDIIDNRRVPEVH